MAKRKRNQPESPAEFWVRGQSIAIKARSLAEQYAHLGALKARVRERARQIEADNGRM